MTGQVRGRASRAGRDEAGISSVEVVLFTPLLVGFMLFVVALGSLVEARGQVYGAARNAAREATQQRSTGAAVDRARIVAEADLRNRCSGSANRLPAVDTSLDGDIIRVDVSCTIDLSGLSWVGLGTSKTVTGTSTAPLDERRRFER